MQYCYFRLSNVQQWQSVADRINELENQQIIHDHKQHYTYLDPSKTNRIANSTLKAFQKNAIQSYFERQQLQQQSIRLSKNNANKNEDLTKLRSIVGGSSSSSSAITTSNEMKNGNIASRPQSLNLSITTSANLSSTSSSASQRSSLSSWPSHSPTMSSSINGSKTDFMMKNANDVAKMNMKNSAMSSCGSEKQSPTNMGNCKNQPINSKIFTTFCEIKTENYSLSQKGFMTTATSSSPLTTTTMSDQVIESNEPPPLPRKNCILRR